jgi:AbrB family looped-hinge helix DNA binding protein
MLCYEAKMSSKGQVTLPVEIRRALDLKEGDQVDFYLDQSSRTVELVARNLKLSDLQGLLKSSAPPLTVKEMDEAIGDALAADDERIKTSWNELREFEEWRRAKAMKAAE